MVSVDYETYRQIKEELSQSIRERDLDKDTLGKLYESKLVYLDHLRVQCFSAINQKRPTQFTIDDYTYILSSIRETKMHLTRLVRSAVISSLEHPFCDKLPAVPKPSDHS